MNLDINNLHHAYLIEGDPKAVAAEIISFLEDSGVKCSGNPDVCQEFFETLSIDDSRALKSLEAEKATKGNKKFFIIGSHFFTREALNSLLKILEEPTVGAHFFLITPSPHLIIDTLRSRMSFIGNSDRNIDKDTAEEAETFLKSNKKKRIELIEKFIKKYKDGEESSLRSEGLKLLNAIEKNLYEAEKGRTLGIQKGSTLGSQIFEFEEIEKIRGYLSDRGASIKMLLEHLALALPELK